MADTPEIRELTARLDRLEESVRPEVMAERVLRVLAQQSSIRSLAPEGLVPVEPKFIPLNPEAPPGASHNSPEDGLRTWLFNGFWTELRLIPRMYFDPRYRLSRWTQIGVPVVLALLIANYVFFSYSPMSLIPVLPAIIERLLVLFFGVVLYKLLSREAVRYKQVLDYLAKYG